jgi:hypothetical protein
VQELSYSMIKRISLSKGWNLLMPIILCSLETKLIWINYRLGLAGLIQSQLDETSFLQSGDFDPIIDGTVVQKDSYLM